MAYHSREDLSKACVCSIEPGALDDSDVELGAISVRTSIGHAHPSSTIVTEDKVLIREIPSEDAVATSAIKVSKISSCRKKIYYTTVITEPDTIKFFNASTELILLYIFLTLHHKIGNDAVKYGATIAIPFLQNHINIM